MIMIRVGDYTHGVVLISQFGFLYSLLFTDMFSKSFIDDGFCISNKDSHFLYQSHALAFYSDTVFFLGNFSKNFILNQKILFGIGASIASFVFFFVIGYLSKYLSQYAQNEKVWKIINIFIISFMSLLTIFVILETVN